MTSNPTTNINGTRSETVAGDGVSNFDDLYRENAGPLLAYLTARVPKSDVEDMAQDFWKTAAEGNFRGGNFRAWMFEVVRNQIIDRSRRWQTKLALKSVSLQREEGQGELPLAAQPVSLLDEEQSEKLNRLRLCLGKLEPRKRQIVEGWLNDRKYREMSMTLGMSEAQISNQFRTAKLQLEKCLEGSR